MKKMPKIICILFPVFCYLSLDVGRTLFMKRQANIRNCEREIVAFKGGLTDNEKTLQSYFPTRSFFNERICGKSIFLTIQNSFLK